MVEVYFRPFYLVTKTKYFGDTAEVPENSHRFPGLRISRFPGFQVSGIPGFLVSGIPEKKNLGFQRIPGIPPKKSGGFY